MLEYNVKGGKMNRGLMVGGPRALTRAGRGRPKWDQHMGVSSSSSSPVFLLNIIERFEANHFHCGSFEAAARTLTGLDL